MRLCYHGCKKLCNQYGLACIKSYEENEMIITVFNLRSNATSPTARPDATKVQRWLSACPQEEEADEEDEGVSERGC